jgi:hypothetical protein
MSFNMDGFFDESIAECADEAVVDSSVVVVTDGGRPVPVVANVVASRKRRRDVSAFDRSWTSQRIEVMNEETRKCKYCSATWSKNTSTGTIATHLKQKHAVSPGNEGEIKPMTQRTLSSTPKLNSKLESLIDSSVAKYFVLSSLPHTHTESDAFREFSAESLTKGYVPKSARTTKRRILEMYAVLQECYRIYFHRPTARSP